MAPILTVQPILGFGQPLPRFGKALEANLGRRLIGLLEHLFAHLGALTHLLGGKGHCLFRVCEQSPLNEL